MFYLILIKFSSKTQQSFSLQKTLKISGVVSLDNVIVIMALTEKKVVGYLLFPRPSPGGHEHLPSPSLYTGTEYRMCCSPQAPTTIKTYIVYTAVVIYTMQDSAH